MESWRDKSLILREITKLITKFGNSDSFASEESMGGRVASEEISVSLAPLAANPAEISRNLTGSSFNM